MIPKERYIDILIEVFANHNEKSMGGSFMASKIIEKLGDDFEPCAAQSYVQDFNDIIEDCLKYKLIDHYSYWTDEDGTFPVSGNECENDFILNKKLMRRSKIESLLNGR